MLMLFVVLLSEVFGHDLIGWCVIHTYFACFHVCFSSNFVACFREVFIFLSICQIYFELMTFEDMVPLARSYPTIIYRIGLVASVVSMPVY